MDSASHDNLANTVWQGLSLLADVEDQVMSILHLGQLQIEVRRRPFAGMMILPVGEQDTADIQKHAGDCRRFLTKPGRK